MLAKLQSQQHIFTKHSTSRDAAVKTSYVFKVNRFRRESSFRSVCWTLICPEKKEALRKCRSPDALLRGELRTSREIWSFSFRAVNFDLFSLALDKSCDERDTAQLLIFLRGITTDFKITGELAAMQSMKGTTTGSDLFTEVNACVEKLGLKWDKLAGVTTDGCPKTGKNVGLLKRMQDKVTEINPEQK